MAVIQWTQVANDAYLQLQVNAKTQRTARQKQNKKKSSKAEGLFRQVAKTIQLLSNDTRHPSLKTHEYSSINNPYDSQKKVFEAYAQNKTPGAYRVFWCYGPGKGEITIVAITPHP